MIFFFRSSLNNFDLLKIFIILKDEIIMLITNLDKIIGGVGLIMDIELIAIAIFTASTVYLGILL